MTISNPKLKSLLTYHRYMKSKFDFYGQIQESNWH